MRARRVLSCFTRSATLHERLDRIANTAAIAFPGELFCPRPCRSAHAHHFLSIFVEPSEAFDQRVDVTRFDYLTTGGINYIWTGRCLRCDSRQAACHRFQQDQSESFKKRREDENVRG